MIQYTRTYIHELLDRFMAGTSTVEEETILSRYFAQEQVPAEWEPYRLLFAEFEAMKPQPTSRRRWLGWGMAAAIAAIGLLTFWMAIGHSSQQQPLVAERQAAHEDTLVQDTPQTLPQQDTAYAYPQQNVAKPRKHRSLRKPEPTPTDLVKAYALMAEAEEACQNAQSEIEQAEMEIIRVRLIAAGYTPVPQEDGTIVYMDEPKNYLVYEE